MKKVFVTIAIILIGIAVGFSIGFSKGKNTAILSAELVSVSDSSYEIMYGNESEIHLYTYA